MAQLYNLADGASLGLIDPGDGLRQLDWKSEIPRMLLEAAQPSALGASSSFPLSNYPEFLEGEGKSGFAGVTLYKASPRREAADAGTGDGSTTAYSLSTDAFGLVLRGSVQVVGRTSGTVLATDNAATGATGTFVATSGATPVLAAGTVTYATGAIADVEFGADPTSAHGGIDFAAKQLATITLSDPVRLTPQNTQDYVLALK